ncbi:MAG: hypothetical protein QM820_13050 [Minicystis sp.]
MVYKIPSPARDIALALESSRRSEPKSGPVPRGTAATADRLAAAGRIRHDDADRAVVYARTRRVWVEDAILELEFMTEAELLRDIATLHATHFVSTDQLARLTIPSRLLSRVPAKVAELCAVFPVLWEDATSTLTVVMGDPGDQNALHDVRVATGVRHIIALAARPGAVRAAIARHYRGDTHAFRTLQRQAGMFELDER